MRHWINLLEAEENSSEIFKSVEKAHATEYKWPMSSVLGDDGISDYFGTKDAKLAVESQHEYLTKLFSSGAAELDRLINVPDEIINSWESYETTGPLNTTHPASWTTAWADIEPEALYTYSQHAELDNLFVIRALVPFSVVNVPLTISRNIRLWWEHEVTLLRMKSIKLISIHRAEKYGHYGDEMRRDLWGQTMLS